MTPPIFQPYVLSEERDAYGRLVDDIYSLACVHCGEGPPLDTEKRCRACWRVLVLSPRGGALTYVPSSLPEKP